MTCTRSIKGHLTTVDDEDYDLLNYISWGVDDGYIYNSDYGYLHRLILRRVLGHNDFEQTDHEDRNKLNNTRTNLRPVTQSQNQHNRTKLCTNKSGYKGVHWHERDKKWRAQIKLNGKRHYLGYFRDKHEAAEAYNKAALELHGEYACLNEINRAS